jgi:hypothetical protein
MLARVLLPEITVLELPPAIDGDAGRTLSTRGAASLGGVCHPVGRSTGDSSSSSCDRSRSCTVRDAGCSGGGNPAARSSADSSRPGGPDCRHGAREPDPGSGTHCGRAPAEIGHHHLAADRPVCHRRTRSVSAVGADGAFLVMELVRGRTLRRELDHRGQAAGGNRRDLVRADL